MNLRNRPVATTEHNMSDVPIRTIEGFQLSILSPEEIKAGSVLQIETAEDLQSPLLGPADNRSRCCQTCGLFDKCPGHRSYIQLCTHLIHGGHIDIIRRILQSVCFQCKRVKIRWQEWVNESGKAFIMKNTQGFC